MFTKIHNTKRGFTLVETMISVSLFTLAIAIVMSVYLFSSKTFAILANFAQLDAINRIALDKMTKDIRESQGITSTSTNGLVFLDQNGNSVTYSFDPVRKLLTRYSGSSSQILITNCDLLTFDVGQRNMTNNTFDSYPWTNGSAVSTIKEVQFKWRAQCKVPGIGSVVNEDIQTAKIVLRATQAQQD